MKKTIVISVLVFAALFLIGCSDYNNVNSFSEDSSTYLETSGLINSESKTEEPVVSKKYEVKNYDYMKAVWLSQFDMKQIYQNGSSQRPIEDFKRLLTTVLDNIKNDGYNTIVVQVRPYADSFYPSEYFPFSNYVGGKFGREPKYDPFEIIVDLAHEKGLSVHAWINPMRCMLVEEIKDVPDDYLIKKWFDSSEKSSKLVEVNGRLYFNPASEEVRELIAVGAYEIALNYDVDGIHMDDYFYPTKEESFDKETYDRYLSLGGKSTLTKFRNEMLDLMVSEIYSKIKEVDENILFGISPAGNIDHTYNDLYADVYKWCSEDGYIDYICPQIYFGLEHQTHDFVSVFEKWNKAVKNEDLRFCVGMTLGKAKQGYDNYAGDGKYEWSENDDIIKRCLEFLKTKEQCSGVFIFCYQYMYDPVSGIEVGETKTERDKAHQILVSLGK